MKMPLLSSREQKKTKVKKEVNNEIKNLLKHRRKGNYARQGVENSFHLWRWSLMDLSYQIANHRHNFRISSANLLGPNICLPSRRMDHCLSDNFPNAHPVFRQITDVEEERVRSWFKFVATQHIEQLSNSKHRNRLLLHIVWNFKSHA